MAAQKLIAVKAFCSYHEINDEVFFEFESRNLIHLVKEKRSYYIPYNQLPLAEKLIRLHLQLGINLEGLEVILPLLERLQSQEDNLQKLAKQVNFYKPLI